MKDKGYSSHHFCRLWEFNLRKGWRLKFPPNTFCPWNPSCRCGGPIPGPPCSGSFFHHLKAQFLFLFFFLHLVWIWSNRFTLQTESQCFRKWPLRGYFPQSPTACNRIMNPTVRVLLLPGHLGPLDAHWWTFAYSSIPFLLSPWFSAEDKDRALRGLTEYVGGMLWFGSNVKMLCKSRWENIVRSCFGIGLKVRHW